MYDEVFPRCARLTAPPVEAGWTAHPAAQELPANIKAPTYVRMTRALRALQAHQQSWPFRSPVNKAEVPDYYEFIKNPMGRSPRTNYMCLHFPNRLANNADQAGKWQVHGSRLVCD
jgi:hypothetical protein